MSYSKLRLSLKLVRSHLIPSKNGIIGRMYVAKKGGFPPEKKLQYVHKKYGCRRNNIL